MRRRQTSSGTALAEPILASAFKDEVRFWAQRLEVKPGEIYLVGMSRKWASCSAHGRVTFDTDLLKQSEEFRREVIIHELLHMNVPNHGLLFTALLRAYLASGEARRD